jgi:hypothetical protein
LKRNKPMKEKWKQSINPSPSTSDIKRAVIGTDRHSLWRTIVILQVVNSIKERQH